MFAGKMFVVVFICRNLFIADHWKNRKNQNLQKFRATPYVISRRGIVQLGSCFGSIFLLPSMSVAGVHAHSSKVNPQPAALRDSPFLLLVSDTTYDRRGQSYRTIPSAKVSSMLS